MVTITMLGLHKSGKTTYMGMMLNCFMDRAKIIKIDGKDNAIKIVPTTMEERTKIAQWRHNSDTEGLIEGRFSAATNKGRANVSSFRFYLKANGQTLSEFMFTDYPGEALEDILLNSTSSEYNNLANTISKSDAVIIFVDAVKLFMYGSIEEAGIALKCSYLNDAIARAANTDGYEQNGITYNHKKKLHIIFALTKCDASIFKPGEDYKLEEKLQKVFSGIFSEYETSIFKVMSIGCNAIESDVRFTINDEGATVLTNEHKILRDEGKDFSPENIVSILISALAKCNETRKENLKIDKQRMIGAQISCENELAAMGGIEKFFLRGKYREKQSKLEEYKRKIAQIDEQIAACSQYKDVFAEIIKQKL